MTLIPHTDILSESRLRGGGGVSAQGGPDTERSHDLQRWEAAPKPLLTSLAQCFVNELRSRIEINAHVERGWIMSLDALVGDVHALIIFSAASPLVLGTVQDVGDAKPRKLSAIWSYLPAHSKKKTETNVTDHLHNASDAILKHPLVFSESAKNMAPSKAIMILL